MINQIVLTQMPTTFKERLKAKSTAAGAQNLTNARLDAMTARLTAKFPDVTEEAELDAKIDDLYDAEMFKEFAALDDFQTAQAARKKAKEQIEKKEPQKGEPEKKDETVPGWAQSLIEQNKALSEKVLGIEKEKTLGSIKQKLQERLKSVPASIWSKRAMPEKEEDLEAFALDVEQDYKTDFIEPGLVTNPGGGNGKNTGKATKEEVSGIVDRILPK